MLWHIMTLQKIGEEREGEERGEVRGEKRRSEV
jgi:hypothetical protein